MYGPEWRSISQGGHVRGRAWGKAFDCFSVFATKQEPPTPDGASQNIVNFHLVLVNVQLALAAFSLTAGRLCTQQVFHRAWNGHLTSQ